MKFITACTALSSALILPVLAQSTENLTYDTKYDDPSLPLTSVACSGMNGFIIRNYTTIGSLPTFPNLGGAYTVTGLDSPMCGTCYNLTVESESIYALVIDVALDGFNLSEEAMNTLTGGLAVELGRAEVTSVEVDASYCGL